MSDHTNPYTDLFMGVLALTIAVLILSAETRIAFNLGPVLPVIGLLGFLYMRFRSVRRF